MLNNFIGGGQIFLHKIRMFVQVFDRSVWVALFVASAITWFIAYPKLDNYDWQGAITYKKASIASSCNEAMSEIRTMVNPYGNTHVAKINAYSKNGLYAKNIEATRILKNSYFKSSYNKVLAFIKELLLLLAVAAFSVFSIIFFLWTKFGKSTKESKQIGGSKVKTAREVASYLRRNNKASDLLIGEMPLVKDTETRHILITGTTGSGKTNLLNTIIPQIRSKKQPAIVIDQTGEMIAHYFTPERGDIIFNPLDSRSHTWDFWADVTSGVTIAGMDSRLEKFSKVLFKFNKKINSSSDPFWDNSAETIFTSCVEALLNTGNKSLSELKKMLNQTSLITLQKQLAGTKAARYLTAENKVTASSILSVVATNTKPLNLLVTSDKQFSIKRYFNEIKNGSNAWLFFATPPDQREVVLPLIACLLELSISYLINAGINEQRRVWFILDELAALGRVNGLSTLMSESRKYGGCVLAATQSINQLFEHFGHYAGSSIFGQFATKFIFRNDEPSVAKIITEIFGQQEYIVQQKNTSYGAHEHRDGVSYTQQEKHKALISTDDLATLVDLECYVGLPEPEVRIAKIKVPPSKQATKKQLGFVFYAAAATAKTTINAASQSNYQESGELLYLELDSELLAEDLELVETLEAAENEKKKKASKPIKEQENELVEGQKLVM